MVSRTKKINLNKNSSNKGPRFVRFVSRLFSIVKTQITKTNIFFSFAFEFMDRNRRIAVANNKDELIMITDRRKTDNLDRVITI